MSRDHSAGFVYQMKAHMNEGAEPVAALYIHEDGTFSVREFPWWERGTGDPMPNPILEYQPEQHKSPLLALAQYTEHHHEKWVKKFHSDFEGIEEKRGQG